MGSDGVHDQALEEGIVGMKRADTQVSSNLMRHYRSVDQANATNRRIGQHSSESSPGALFSSLLVWMKWSHKGNVLGEPKAKHIVLLLSIDNFRLPFYPLFYLFLMLQIGYSAVKVLSHS